MIPSTIMGVKMVTRRKKNGCTHNGFGDMVTRRARTDGWALGWKNLQASKILLELLPCLIEQGLVACSECLPQAVPKCGVVRAGSQARGGQSKFTACVECCASCPANRCDAHAAQHEILSRSCKLLLWPTELILQATLHDALLQVG
mmetsp:Transcript_38010/g.81742  ORF Transcript_38010/g.81742 Transcript_38010/m.81742 type:complete len:146 (+) Transcript_38010:79-516(+)